MKRQSKFAFNHHTPLKSSVKATAPVLPSFSTDSAFELQFGSAQMYLNSFWNLMGLAICAVDKKFKIMERNEGFLDWTKSTLNKRPQVGTILFDIFPPQTAKTLKGLFKAALKREHHLADIQLDLKKESKWIFVRVCPLFHSDGDIVGVLMTLRDLTAQKRIEQENTYNRQLYLTLARHIPDSNMFLIDKDKRFLIVEGTELRQLGIEPESLSGKLIHQFDPNLASVLEPLLKKVFRGKDASVEFEHQSRVYALKLVPVKNESRKIYAAMGLMRNITDAKQIERKLIESLQENERALRDLAEANEIKPKFSKNKRAKML